MSMFIKAALNEFEEKKNIIEANNIWSTQSIPNYLCFAGILNSNGKHNCFS